MPLLRRPVREDQKGTVGWIEARGHERGDRHDETINQDRYAALRGSDHGAADRRDLKSAYGAQDPLRRRTRWCKAVMDQRRCNHARLAFAAGGIETRTAAGNYFRTDPKH